MTGSFSAGIVSKQLVRSATSVGANITEARASSSRKDFINYYNHALRSANESKYWISLLRDACDMPSDRLGPLQTEADEIGRMLGASILTMKDRGRF